MNETKAIVLGCSATSLPIIRSLGRKGIPIVAIDHDKNGIGLCSKYVNESVLAPHPGKSSEEFISLLLNNSTKWRNAVLIPTDDYIVSVLSQNEAKLSKYYIVTVPEWDVVEKCINKKLTYEIAKKAKIPVPKTVFPDSLEYLETHKDEFVYPCILKPLFAREFAEELKVGKMFKIDNFEELKSKFIFANKRGFAMMITELVPGNCDRLYTYYGYRDLDGRFLAESTLRKLKQVPPDLGYITVGETTYTPEVIDHGRKFLKELSYTGICNVEFKKDPRDGKFKLIEINARCGRVMDLLIHGGMDFPWIMYKDLVDNEKIDVSTYEVGLKWVHLSDNLMRIIKHHKQEKWSFKEFIDIYRGKKVFCVYDSEDLRPFIKEWLWYISLTPPYIIRKLVKKR